MKRNTAKLATSTDPYAPESWTAPQVKAAIATLPQPLPSNIALPNGLNGWDKQSAINQATNVSKSNPRNPNKDGIDAQKLGGPINWFKSKYTSLGKHTGGAWDIKKIDRKYERYGNVMYGFLGKKTGIETYILRAGAGKYQGTGKSTWTVLTDKYWGDDPDDYGFVGLGIRAYELGISP